MAQAGPEAAEFQMGDAVEAVFPDDGEWYPGTIEKDNGDGTFEVHWQDPDGGPETSPCKPSDMKKAVRRTPLHELKTGSKVRGTITSVRDFGAFVDIGAERDGLVFIGKMPRPEAKTGPFEVDDPVDALCPDDGEWYPGVVGKDRGDGAFDVRWDDPDGGPESHAVKPEDMRHVERAVQTDDEVEVWIERITEDGKLQLTMLPPPDLSAFRALHPDEWLEGRVHSIASFGLFVVVKPPQGGTEQRGLVHASQIKNGFVDDPRAEAEEGQVVKVRVLDVDEEASRLSLSMREVD